MVWSSRSCFFLVSACACFSARSYREVIRRVPLVVHNLLTIYHTVPARGAHVGDTVNCVSLPPEKKSSRGPSLVLFAFLRSFSRFYAPSVSHSRGPSRHHLVLYPCGAVSRCRASLVTQRFFSEIRNWHCSIPKPSSRRLRDSGFGIPEFRNRSKRCFEISELGPWAYRNSGIGTSAFRNSGIGTSAFRNSGIGWHFGIPERGMDKTRNAPQRL